MLNEIFWRYEEVEQEINELTEEKDKLRDEKNEILLKLNKQIEHERSDRRNAKAEADKAHVRVRQLEIEIQNLQNKVLDKEKDNQLLASVSFFSFSSLFTPLVLRISKNSKTTTTKSYNKSLDFNNKLQPLKKPKSSTKASGKSTSQDNK